LEWDSLIEAVFHSGVANAADLGTTNDAQQVDIVEGARCFGKRET
jgi:hypothetical protein